MSFIDYPKVKIKKNLGKRVMKGHLWIFRGELEESNLTDIKEGPVVVESSAGRFIGIGDYSPRSQIAVRLLTRRKNTINDKFFYKRISFSLDLRRSIYPGENSFRAVFAEGDLLPGLIVDKYADFLSVQILTAAMEARRDLILEVLEDIFQPSGIVLRADSPSRRYEGLELYVDKVSGNIPDRVTISDNGVNFRVDITGGEKTGYFFDQRENRYRLKNIVKGAEVLDVFCYTGAFSIFAAKYGAKSVRAVDISRNAIDTAMENAGINGFGDIIDFHTENAFDYLRESSKRGEKFDVVILDPPAFTRDKHSIESAYRGYKEINLRALKLVRDGGFLLTFSCSYHFSIDDFKDMLIDAASDIKKTIQILYEMTQSPDHPVLTAVPETRYLKGFMVRVIK